MIYKKKSIKFLFILILITIPSILLSGCNNNKDKADVSIIALKGPTGMGMVKFIDDSNSNTNMNHNYKFKLTGSIDEVTPLLAKGEVDIAAVPANVASVLYNNTNGDIQVLAINTLGVIYIVENGNSINSVSDLKGKTIYASGKGATPEYNLNYILTNNGIDPEKDLTIEWKSEHTECLAALSSEENAIAMLPQPFVTTAQTKLNNLRIALDLTKEWDAIQDINNEQSTLITGVIVARTDFIKDNPEVIKDFLLNYKKSVEYVNSNVTDAAILIGKYEIVEAGIAEKAISLSNITYIDGIEMKEKLSGYLNVLYKQNPKSIGELIPNDNFYYIK